MSHLPAQFKSILVALVAAGITPVLGAETAAQNNAKNLARMNCGAHIELVAPSPSFVDALLWDDNTLSWPLRSGDTTFVIALSSIASIDRFAFINEDAAARGHFDFAVSSCRLDESDSRWVPVPGSTNFTGQRFFSFSMVGVEAKYVRLIFHIEKEGRFAGVGLYGQKTLEHFAAVHEALRQPRYGLALTSVVDRPEDALNFNFANLYARARIAYVSSGELPSAARMIDDDARTAYRFSAADEHPTVIVELAENERLHRVSAVYQSEAGELEVYLLHKLSKDPGDLQNATKVISTVDAAGQGKAAINFEPGGARYVALRWTRRTSQHQAFEIAEIGAFGVVPLSLLQGESLAFAQIETHLPGEGSTDFSTSLGTLADPPTVSFVSP